MAGVISCGFPIGNRVICKRCKATIWPGCGVKSGLLGKGMFVSEPNVQHRKPEKMTKRIAFLASEAKVAQTARDSLVKRYGNAPRGMRKCGGLGRGWVHAAHAAQHAAPRHAGLRNEPRHYRVPDEQFPRNRPDGTSGSSRRKRLSTLWPCWPWISPENCTKRFGHQRGIVAACRTAGCAAENQRRWACTDGRAGL